MRGIVPLGKLMDVDKRAKGTCDHCVHKPMWAVKFYDTNRESLPKAEAPPFEGYGLSEPDLFFHPLVSMTGSFGVDAGISHQIETDLRRGVDPRFDG
jgi:hypothetical protein